MPSYNSLPNLPSLAPYTSYNLFDAESKASIVAAGSTSQQVALVPDDGTGRNSLYIEGFFSADPGNFEVDIQFASTDADAYYITPQNGGQITSVVGSGNYHFSQQFDAPGTLGIFVRAKLVSCANSVNLTVKATR